MVAFLYHRFRFGIYITLAVSLLASLLAWIELEIQGRGYWVIGWYASLCAILLVRWQGLQRFLNLPNKHYFPYRLWHRRFLIGVSITGLHLGGGAALIMPYLTGNVQVVVHAMLITMCAGAIAYLSTSFRVYISYMLSMMIPVTLWLFTQRDAASLVLGCLYFFFMAAGWVSVRHMNRLVNDALYYRYDNEDLIEDLERLLQSVSQSNKALEKISLTDELSGISNYRAFRVYLEDLGRQNGEPAGQISLIKFNLDRFREFNSRYGQQAGDQCLRDFAALLSEQLTHHKQMAARLQGAEFALILPECSCENARRIAREISTALAARKIEHTSSNCGNIMTLSAGIGCLSTKQGVESRELLIRTETALKLAVERGGNRIEVLEGG